MDIVSTMLLVLFIGGAIASLASPLNRIAKALEGLQKQSQADNGPDGNS